MHPLFANSDPNVVPPQTNPMVPSLPDQSMMYGQQQQQHQLPPTMMNPTNNYYQQQPSQPVYDPNVNNNNAINYQNFATNIPGAQGLNNQMTYPIETVHPVKEIPIVHEKPPLPEEFIHFETVFEEIKNRCISAANNPVRYYSFEILIKIFLIIILFQ